jgi:hypothetical protein
MPSLDQRVGRLLEAAPPDHADAREFLGARFDHGLAWVHFPEGMGGLGLPRADQDVVDSLLRDAGAPAPFEQSTIGLGMVAPVSRSLLRCY